MLGIEYKLAHIGITVSNLEDSIDFYRKNFGFKEISRKDKPELSLKLVSLQLGESYLELIEPYFITKIKFVGEKKESLSELLKKSESHLALSTNKIHSAYLKLKENKVDILTDFDEKFFFCKDPDGFLIEVKQR